MVRPNSPQWPAAVQRAADILKDYSHWPKARAIQMLIHSCQHVPVKYIVDLYDDAKKL